jgi:uncharacterized protein (TIGR00255 family)
MIFSMTGYGLTKQSFERQIVTVEIRSLNSKNFDLRLRMPNTYLSYELDLRRVLQTDLQRGKVEVSIYVESAELNDYKINKTLLESYLYQLSEVAAANGFEKGDILASAARLPNVVQQMHEQADETLWVEILQTLAAAQKQFISFRQIEGASIETDISNRLEILKKLLLAVENFESERLEKIKIRLRQQLEQLVISVDENRFAQELIYYLEKYDVSEEKNRLQQHYTYFESEMRNNQTSKGNKLGFIVQEMGREINTLGSKANSADIQQLVVQMKDELEKIKEQIANVL